MSADGILLLFSFSICWITLLLLSLKTDGKKRVLINLTLHVIYSSYFLYGIFYKSQGTGTSLAWWFYLLLLLWAHCIINFGQLVYLYFKTKKQN